MNSETVLTWSVTNWITVVVMAVLGFAVIGLVANQTKKLSAKNASA